MKIQFKKDDDDHHAELNYSKHPPFVKHTCSNCNKTVTRMFKKYDDWEFNYSTLINSRKEFFNKVELCPECGYVMLFNNTDVSKQTKKYIKTNKVYLSTLKAKGYEPGFKKWLLFAYLSEYNCNYTEAGIAYTKAYDFLEFNNLPLDPILLTFASDCFLAAVKNHSTYIDALLAVDAMRRAGKFDLALETLSSMKNIYKKDKIDLLIEKEKVWITAKSKHKYNLDI